MGGRGPATRRPERPLSPISERANRIVAERLPQATALGVALADLIDGPAIRGCAPRWPDRPGRSELPGGPAVHRARARQIARCPLAAAFGRSPAVRPRHPASPPDSLLWLANRLLQSQILELRIFTFGLLTRSVPSDPERSWQLLRQAARQASNWIVVDSLAHAYGSGILLERFRWAEIEQLVFSPSGWERRLVASTIATIPFVDRRAGRTLDIADRALPILTDLIGDADPNVQKALSWALRSMALIDVDRVAEFCERQAAIAASTDDGHRARVVRDALAPIEPARAVAIRAQLTGLRRRPNAPSTSRASIAAARFNGLLADTPPPIDRSRPQ